MCTDTIDVLTLRSTRTAYEVEQFLNQMPNIDNVVADEDRNCIEIQYDESAITRNTVLDFVEQAGCQPTERVESWSQRLLHG